MGETSEKVQQSAGPEAKKHLAEKNESQGQPQFGFLLQRAQVDPRSLTPADVLHLQRSIGNRATGRLLAQRLPVQTKLQLGPANDKYEQEADAVARQVVRRMAAPPVQRDNELGEDVQAKSRYDMSAYSSPQPAPAKRGFVAPKVQRDEMDEELAQAKPLAATISTVQRSEGTFAGHAVAKPKVQREEMDEELAQAKPLAATISTVQRSEGTFAGHAVVKPKVQRNEMDEELAQAKPLAATISTVQRSQGTFAGHAVVKSRVQRDEMDEELAQASPSHGLEGGDVEQGVAQTIQRAKGGGSELDPKTRSGMEGAFGARFGGVRVHTDAQSDTLNRSLNARAFTTGKDIFFRKGEYNPGTSGGKELLAHELTHVVQQSNNAINRRYHNDNVVQRVEEEEVNRGGLGTIVSYEQTEPMPETGNGFVYAELTGSALEVQKGKFTRGFRENRRYFTKRAETQASGNIRRDKIRKDFLTPKETLFDAQSGGATTGTFEYVANYLWNEVVKVLGLGHNDTISIWGSVWEVVPINANDPVSELKLQKKIPDGDGDAKKAVLNRMIGIGLDAEWKKLPVQNLMQQAVEGGRRPAERMAHLDIAPGILEYVSNWWNNLPSPTPKTVGVAFHTTDGGPDKVMKSKQEGGWEGISTPMTAQFFQNNFALNQPWNPLGTWLKDKGPAFRKGVQDNELLSTVSLATDLHGSVKFPLANPTRSHIKEDKENQPQRFKMTAYSYAVVFKEAYATFARQGKNPFPEIATGDVPIKDIIGYCVVTRWHDYFDEDTKTSPQDASFTYQISDFIENPDGPGNPALVALARQSFANERARTNQKYDTNVG